MTQYRTACPSCMTALKVKFEHDGKMINCPRCQTKFSVSLRLTPEDQAKRDQTPTEIPRAIPIAVPAPQNPPVPKSKKASDSPPPKPAASVKPAKPVPMAKPIPVAKPAPIEKKAPLAQPVQPAVDAKPKSPAAKPVQAIPVAKPKKALPIPKSSPEPTTSIPQAVNPIVATPPNSERVLPTPSNQPEQEKKTSEDLVESPYMELASSLDPHGGNTDGQNPEGSKRSSYPTTNPANQKQSKEREIGAGATQWIIRGIALILFGFMVISLGLLGFTSEQMQYVNPIGSMFGVIFGTIGSLMVTAGFYRRIRSAILFGGLPSVLFVLAGYGVMSLNANGYWDSASPSQVSKVDRAPVGSGRSVPAVNPPHPDFSSPDMPFGGQSASRRQSQIEFELERQRNALRQRSLGPGFPQQSRATPSPMRSQGRGLPPFDGQHMSSIFRRSFGIENVGLVVQSSVSNRRRTLNEREYTSIAGNPDVVIGKSFTHPDRNPVIGIDLIAAIRGNQIGALIPIFSSSEPSVSLADPGYALGSINVLSDQGMIVGLQCVFMKLENDRLNSEDYYDGEWIGLQPHPSETPDHISGEGRLVYGLWAGDFGDLKSIRLIHQPE